MQKPSFAVHISPEGKLTVLAASVDAAECLDAFKACDDAGEVIYFQRPSADRRKSYAAKPAPPARKSRGSE